eukprot:Clim_evm87s149 gene=Clim_evmTU87s149
MKSLRSSLRRSRRKSQRAGSIVSGSSCPDDTISHVSTASGAGQLAPVLYTEFRDKELTKLQRACKAGDAPKVRSHTKPTTINQLDSQDRFSAIHLAAWCGHDLIVKFLVDQGADLLKDAAGATPLMVAITAGNVETVRVLAAVDDLNAQDKTGTSILHYCVHMGSPQIMQLILSASVKRNTALKMDAKDQESKSVLHYAAITPEGVDLCTELLKFGADPNIADQQYRTPLMKAAQQGRMDICDLLIMHGATLDNRDISGKQAHDLAMIADMTECASFLRRKASQKGPGQVAPSMSRARSGKELSSQLSASLLYSNPGDRESEAEIEREFDNIDDDEESIAFSSEGGSIDRMMAKKADIPEDLLLGLEERQSVGYRQTGQNNKEPEGAPEPEFKSLSGPVEQPFEAGAPPPIPEGRGTRLLDDQHTRHGYEEEELQGDVNVTDERKDIEELIHADEDMEPDVPVHTALVEPSHASFKTAGGATILFPTSNPRSDVEEHAGRKLSPRVGSAGGLDHATKIQSLEEQLSNAKQTISMRDQHIQSQDQEIRQLEDVAYRQDEKLQTLGGSLKDIQVQMKKELTELLDTKANHLSEIEGFERTLSLKDTELREMREKLKRKDRLIKESQDQLRMKQRELENASMSNEKSMVDAASAARADADMLREKAEAARAEADRLLAEKDALVTQARNRETEMLAITDRLNTVEDNNARELQRVDSELTLRSNEIANKNELLAAKDREIEALKEEAHRLRNNNTGLNELRHTATTNENRIAGLLAEISSLKDAHGRELQNLQHSYSMEMQTANDRARHAQDEVAELDKSRTKSVTEVQRLTEDLMKAEARVDELRLELSTHKDKERDVNEELGSLRLHLRTAEQKITQMEIAQTAELQERDQTLQNAEFRISELQRVVDNSEARIHAHVKDTRKDWERELSQALAKKDEEYEDRLRALEEQHRLALQETDAKTQDLEDALKESQRLDTASQKQLREVSGELERVRAEDVRDKERFEREMTSRDRTISMLKQENERYKLEVETYNAHNAELRIKVDEAQSAQRRDGPSSRSQTPTSPVPVENITPRSHESMMLSPREIDADAIRQVKHTLRTMQRELHELRSEHSHLQDKYKEKEAEVAALREHDPGVVSHQLWPQQAQQDDQLHLRVDDLENQVDSLNRSVGYAASSHRMRVLDPVSVSVGHNFPPPPDYEVHRRLDELTRSLNREMDSMRRRFDETLSMQHRIGPWQSTAGGPMGVASFLTPQEQERIAEMEQELKRHAQKEDHLIDTMLELRHTLATSSTTTAHCMDEMVTSQGANESTIPQVKESVERLEAAISQRMKRPGLHSFSTTSEPFGRDFTQEAARIMSRREPKRKDFEVLMDTHYHNASTTRSYSERATRMLQRARSNLDYDAQRSRHTTLRP